MAELLKSNKHESAVWKNCRIEDFCTTASGGTPLTTRRDYYEGGHIPWLRSGEVAQGRVRHAEISITQAGLDNSSAKLFKKGTILVAMYGATAGEVGVLEFESATNQAVCGVAPGPSVDGEFLFQALLLRKPALIKMAGGGAQPNISQEIIRNFKIPLPPLAEQRKIAEILRTWDEAIETAEAELKAKQERKRGLMQKMINPSAEGAGALMMKGPQTVLLSKLGTLKKGGAILREKLRPEGAAVILYGDIYTKYSEIVTRFVSRVDPSAVVDGVRLNSGDIVFAGSGETAEEIGKCIAYVGNEEAYAGGDVVILSNHGQDACYLGYALNAGDAIRQKMRLGQGSSVMHLYKDDVGSIRIPLPPVAEQRMIAQVLQSEDAAIDSLKVKADLLRAQKRGLMQKLLTGEVRVAA